MVLYNRNNDSLLSDGWTTCDRCNGSGEFVRGRFRGKCFACDGKGRVDSNGGKSSSLSGVTPAVASHPLIRVERIVDALVAAKKSGLKTPSLRFEGWTFALKRDSTVASPVVYVRKTDRDGGSDYIGKIVNGELQARYVDSTTITALRSFIAACDPEAEAIRYGRATGTCSCCGRELTNKISIQLGIGPICRGNFGWLVDMAEFDDEEIRLAMEADGNADTSDAEDGENAKKESETRESNANEQASTAEDAPSAEAGESTEAASSNATADREEAGARAAVFDDSDSTRPNIGDDNGNGVGSRIPAWINRLLAGRSVGKSDEKA